MKHPSWKVSLGALALGGVLALVPAASAGAVEEQDTTQTQTQTQQLDSNSLYLQTGKLAQKDATGSTDSKAVEGTENLFYPQDEKKLQAYRKNEAEQQKKQAESLFLSGKIAAADTTPSTTHLFTDDSQVPAETSASTSSSSGSVPVALVILMGVVVIAGAVCAFLLSKGVTK